jgi:HNH endonuclease
MQKTCSVEDCDKPHDARGLCHKHYQRVLRKENPEYAERQRAISRAWRATNLERLQAYDRERKKQPKWRTYDQERNQRPERQAAQIATARVWREANKEYVREYNWTPERRAFLRESGRTIANRRRAVKLNTEIEQFVDTEIFERDGWRCHICRRQVRRNAPGRHPLSASLDHIVPLSKGGTHTRDNVACAHLKCNMIKQASLGAGVQQLLIG